MGSIRVRGETGLLFMDFRYRNKRCREQTPLTDTPRNRQKLEKWLAEIEMEIKTGRFDYARHFPTSPNARLFEAAESEVSGEPKASVLPAPVQAAVPETVPGGPSASERSRIPLFKEFIEEWFAENEVAWRRSHIVNIRGMIRKHFVPWFGETGVDRITRADLLKFRSSLGKVQGRNGEGLSANRYEFNTPFRRIKPLKIKKPEVQPFTLEEVRLILESVRVDYRNYYTVRFFTGMRTGEIDGLKWKYVDFDRRLIYVRETIVAGEEDDTKTIGSVRDIQMSQVVYDALRQQHKATAHLSPYVFCNLKGNPLEHVNVTKRILYPLLASLNLERRRPYQTRHTAATLWLAAGEAPEWIARQMGHVNTEMLFKVYSRYVPNLTRQDGSAFERMLQEKLHGREGGQQESSPAASGEGSHEPH